MLCKPSYVKGFVNRQSVIQNSSLCASSTCPKAFSSCLKKTTKKIEGRQELGNRQHSVSTFAVSNNDSHATDHRRVGETEDQAAIRRAKESAIVEEKMITIYNSTDFSREIHAAGDTLVVLEVESQVICNAGLDTADSLLKIHQHMDMTPCVNLKHTLQRCARDCPDVKFLRLLGDLDAPSRALCEELHVGTVPCIQFYKHGEMMWEINGLENAVENLGQGVLYYAGYDAHGKVAAGSDTLIPEISTQAELTKFLQSAGNEIAVLDISSEHCEPCVKMFPAVLAMNKNMKGHVRFGRSLVDTSEETMNMWKAQGVTETPTFLFFKNGNLEMKFLPTTRGQLIDKVLQVQRALGDGPLPGHVGRTKPSQAKAPPRRASGQAMW